MGFKTKNLNYAFNVEYYSEVLSKVEEYRQEEIIKEKNKQFIDLASGITCGEETEDINLHCQKMYFTVDYPGALIGTGYIHNSGVKGEIVSGFTFDYVTGLPYLPGSSLKGILKSAFRHEEYIDSIIEDVILNKNKYKLTSSEIEMEIFEGIDIETKKRLPIYMRDKFLDSYVVTDKKGLIKLDTITPHGRQQNNDNKLETFDIMTEPNPNNFIRVAPSSKFELRYLLHPIKKNKVEILSIQDKMKIFAKILDDFGIGAKTNVGYGQGKAKNI